MKERTLTDETLYTFLVEVEWIMNTRPLTPVSDSPDDFSALKLMTLLGGSLDSSLPPDVFFQADEYRRSWRAVQLLADLFWRRWMKEYLPLLQRRQKWLKPQRNLKVGDLVLVCDKFETRRVAKSHRRRNLPRRRWNGETSTSTNGFN